MPSRFLVAVACGLIIAGLVVPSAVASVDPSPTARSPPPALGWTTDAVALPSNAHDAPLPGSTPVSISVALRPSNGSTLARLAEEFAGPGGDQRGFLTESQFEADFSPSPAHVRAIETYLSAFGGQRFGVTPDGLGVSAVLPASGVDAAFGVQLVRFGAQEGPTEYTALGTPALPAALGATIVGVGGLSNADAATWDPYLAVLARGAVSEAAHAGAFVTDNLTGDSWFIGSDYTQAYTVSSLFPPASTVANATFPTGEAVATLLMGGYNSTTSADLPPFDPVAVDAYFNDTFPAAWPHPDIQGVPVTIDGVTPPLPGGDGAINDTSLDDTENALDLEMAGSLAPGATVVNFYFAGSLYLAANANPTVGNVADDFATELSAALSHNYGGARLAAVTNSYGLSDLNDSLWDTEMLHAAVTGVTIVASSGDQADAPASVSGRSQGQWPGWPATAAFNTSGTVSVGGVSVQLGGAAAGWTNETYLNDSFDANETGLSGQVAWYDTNGGAGNVSGTEGGLSTIYPEPGWQFDSAAQPNVIAAGEVQQASFLGRAGPDVAFAANDTIVYDAHDASGVYFDLLEGTSVAAPLFAGLLASCAAVSGHSYGLLDPELYRIASYFTAYPTAGPIDPLLPATSGNNYEFTATTGWDSLTGWGGLDAVDFLTADATPSVADYNYTGPPPTLPPLPPPPPAPTYATPYAILFILGVGVTLAVVAVLVVGYRRPHPPGTPPPPYGPTPPPVRPAYGAAWSPGSVPPGAGGLPPSMGSLGPPPVPPPASFLCPYCGRPRPAEPVRCPSCGAL